MKSLDALRALGSGAEPPPEAKQRVYGALLASLATAAASVGPAAGKLPATLGPAPAPLLAGLASSKAALIAAGIWLFGGATGAALYGAFYPPQVRVVYVDRPVLTPPAPVIMAEHPAGASSAMSAGSSSSSPIAGRRNTAAASSSPADRAGSDLAGERALLDSARANAAHGEPAQVLEQVARHARLFPHGRLTEEREALAIRALLALGRSDEARARADAFRAAYPHSFLTPVIDSALSAP